MAAIVVRSQRVVLPDRVRPAAVYIKDGRITAIRDYAHIRDDVTIIEAGQHVVMPGLVDTHVHINEPGRTDWEVSRRQRARQPPAASRRSSICP